MHLLPFLPLGRHNNEPSEMVARLLQDDRFTGFFLGPADNPSYVCHPNSIVREDTGGSSAEGTCANTRWVPIHRNRDLGLLFIGQAQKKGIMKLIL